MSLNPLSDAAFDDLSQQRLSDGDRQLHVSFFHEEIPDPKLTLEMGRQMYRTVEMCSIRRPGDRDVRIDRVEKMRPDPRLRFPLHYARFKAGEKVQVKGTLLREWGVIDRATAKSYEAVDIHTVEQLAGLSDTVCQQYRGSLADRQKARDWLDQVKGLEPVAKARAEAEELRAQVQALREQLEEQGHEIEKLTAPARKVGKG